LGKDTWVLNQFDFVQIMVFHGQIDVDMIGVKLAMISLAAKRLQNPFIMRFFVQDIISLENDYYAGQWHG